jgi:hypothetical protein
VGVLRDTLLALYSHCLNFDTTVAEVLAIGRMDGNLQPHLFATAVEELDLLSSVIGSLELRAQPDTQWLPGHSRGTPCAINF